MELAGQLTINVAFIAGYCGVCCAFPLCAALPLHLQTIAFIFSAVVHASIQRFWGTKTLNKFDIIPIAIMLLSKAQQIPWVVHIVCTGILSAVQILISKLPASTKTNASASLRLERPLAQISNSLRDDIWLEDGDLISCL